MDSPLPGIARWTFIIHLIVAILLGVSLLLFPSSGTMLGYPDEPDLMPVVSGLGAIILGFGGLTSFYGARAKRWGSVDYIVRGEMLYLAIQTVVYIVALVQGAGPVLGNVVFLIVTAVLLALFCLSWTKRPR